MAGQARDHYLHIRDEDHAAAKKMHWANDRDSFEAGAQYALDEFLHKLGHLTVGPMHFEHSIAADILKRLKKKGPL